MCRRFGEEHVWPSALVAGGLFCFAFLQNGYDSPQRMTKLSATKRQRGVTAYRTYVARLKTLANETQRADGWSERAVAALDGEASRELRKIISLKTRRRFGAFFTGSELAAQLIKHCTNLGKASVIHDPTVGMADLLIAVAKKLPLERTINETLKQWGRQLTGTDIHPEFIEGAKTRLLILARQRHGLKAAGITTTAGLFPGIRVADGLAARKAFARATHLTLNPPFVLTEAPAGCKWAGGRITQAAMFVITALEQAKPGTELVAILPDVLRSGSFTEKWRQRVEELATVKLVKPHGIFDKSADVDVFLLRLKCRAENSKAKSVKWSDTPASSSSSIGDFFEVHVGRVVPHRDPEEGKSHPYIHARCVPTWEVMREFDECRRHAGKVYQAPFVVIRRTSRPGHPYRAAATVIAGKQKVAVENHLIVCEPKDGTLRACKDLMTKLQTETVNEFLDARIRCRHLTVGSVAAIPFQPE